MYNEPVSSAAATLTGPSSVLRLPRSSTGMLVRPDWGTLGGDRPATVSTVRFRGPHSDYLLDTEGGRLLLRVPGISVHSPGDQVSWTLTRSWPLDVTDQVPSSPAGPE